MNNNDKLLTRNQAAEILGLSPATLAVWKSTKRYDLPIVMIGRLPKYRLSDVAAFIERNVISTS